MFAEILEETKADDLLAKIRTARRPFIDFVTKTLDDRALYTDTVSTAQISLFHKRDENSRLAKFGIMYIFCQAVHDAELSVSETKRWICVMDRLSEALSLTPGDQRLIGVIWILDNDFPQSQRYTWTDYPAFPEICPFIFRVLTEKGSANDVIEFLSVFTNVLDDPESLKLLKMTPQVGHFLKQSLETKQRKVATCIVSVFSGVLSNNEDIVTGVRDCPSDVSHAILEHLASTKAGSAVYLLVSNSEMWNDPANDSVKSGLTKTPLDVKKASLMELLDNNRVREAVRMLFWFDDLLNEHDAVKRVVSLADLPDEIREFVDKLIDSGSTWEALCFVRWFGNEWEQDEDIADVLKRVNAPVNIQAHVFRLLVRNGMVNDALYFLIDFSNLLEDFELAESFVRSLEIPEEIKVYALDDLIRDDCLEHAVCIIRWFSGAWLEDENVLDHVVEEIPRNILQLLIALLIREKRNKDALALITYFNLWDDPECKEYVRALVGDDGMNAKEKLEVLDMLVELEKYESARQFIMSFDLSSDADAVESVIKVMVHCHEPMMMILRDIREVKGVTAKRPLYECFTKEAVAAKRFLEYVVLPFNREEMKIIDEQWLDTDDNKRMLAQARCCIRKA